MCSRVLEDIGATAARARNDSPLPVLIGVGIDTPRRAAEAARHADGVIVGSALVRDVLRGATAADLAGSVAALRAAVDSAAEDSAAVDGAGA